ncbi:MAG: hypothetical protein RLY93_16680 [Sumerlaeia bacterium]
MSTDVSPSPTRGKVSLRRLLALLNVFVLASVLFLGIPFVHEAYRELPIARRFRPVAPLPSIAPPYAGVMEKRGQWPSSWNSSGIVAGEFDEQLKGIEVVQSQHFGPDLSMSERGTVTVRDGRMVNTALTFNIVEQNLAVYRLDGADVLIRCDAATNRIVAECPANDRLSWSYSPPEALQPPIGISTGLDPSGAPVVVVCDIDGPTRLLSDRGEVIAELASDPPQRYLVAELHENPGHELFLLPRDVSGFAIYALDGSQLTAKPIDLRGAVPLSAVPSRRGSKDFGVRLDFPSGYPLRLALADGSLEDLAGEVAFHQSHGWIARSHYAILESGWTIVLDWSTIFLLDEEGLVVDYVSVRPAMATAVAAAPPGCGFDFVVEVQDRNQMRAQLLKYRLP